MTPGALLTAQLAMPSTRPAAVRLILRALRHADGSQLAAAQALGVGRSTLRRWLAQDSGLADAAAKWARPRGRNRLAGGGHG